METDSSSDMRSAGSADVVSEGSATLTSKAGIGSGSHSPTYTSRRLRADRSWSRQIRVMTLVSQAPGVLIAFRSDGGWRYQRR